MKSKKIIENKIKELENALKFATTNCIGHTLETKINMLKWVIENEWTA